MEEKKLMSISEFSRMTGIKRVNLIFYDKIGLLTPQKRGENDYRYYSRRQLDYAFMIISLRELGIGLEEIKNYARQRTPELMVSLFHQQEQRIVEEMQKLKKLREIMDLHVSNVSAVPFNPSGQVEIVTKEPEPIFRGPTLTCGQTEDESMLEFYNLLTDNKMALGYPLGVAVSPESLSAKPAGDVIYYYLRINSQHNAKKPPGEYAVLYDYCSYGKSGNAYNKLLAFLDENHWKVCDNIFEEYPLNELCIPNNEEYCVRLEVPVRRL